MAGQRSIKDIWWEVIIRMQKQRTTPVLILTQTWFQEVLGIKMGICYILLKLTAMKTHFPVHLMFMAGKFLVLYAQNKLTFFFNFDVSNN